MSDFGTDEIDELMGQTRRALDQMRSARRERESDEERTGTGVSFDGQIRATVTGGRVESLSVEPRLMRLPSEELCAGIMAAVNAALDETKPPEAEAEAGPTVDPDALADQLQQVQEQSMRQMRQISSALNDALARMREARG